MGPGVAVSLVIGGRNISAPTYALVLALFADRMAGPLAGPRRLGVCKDLRSANAMVTTLSGFSIAQGASPKATAPRLTMSDKLKISRAIGGLAHRVRYQAKPGRRIRLDVIVSYYCDLLNHIFRR